MFPISYALGTWAFKNAVECVLPEISILIIYFDAKLELFAKLGKRSLYKPIPNQTQLSS